jgi:hypothetical protein
LLRTSRSVCLNIFYPKFHGRIHVPNKAAIMGVYHDIPGWGDLCDLPTSAGGSGGRCDLYPHPLEPLYAASCFKTSCVINGIHINIPMVY